TGRYNPRMNLSSQAVQRIDSRGLNLNEQALLRCQLAKELEGSGNYEAAREAMGEFWQRIGKRPHIKGLDQHATAEVLLRAGSLSGWIGSTNQIDGAQETAKDLISKSVTIFEALQETEKVAEAYIDLAICYWREGAFNEARVTLQESLSRLSDENSEQRARALLNSAVIEISLNQFNDALNILKKATPLFEESQSQPAKG